MFHVKRWATRVRGRWTRQPDSTDNGASNLPVPVVSESARSAAGNTGAIRVTVDTLGDIRSRLVPMLEVVAEQYEGRVPRGFPHVINDPTRGLVGLEIDAAHALYVTSESDGNYAEFYRRDPRTDNRSGASREKFAGQPYYDRRKLSDDMSDQALRNLIAEVMSHFNMQPGLLYITDD
jgi:hypothetical protein